MLVKQNSYVNPRTVSAVPLIFWLNSILPWLCHLSFSYIYTLSQERLQNRGGKECHIYFLSSSSPKHWKTPGIYLE